MDVETTTTLALWRAWQQAQGLSERTITERAATIRRLCLERGVSAPKLTTLDALVFAGKPGLKPRSRWTYQQHIRAFTAWMVKAHIRDDDPLIDAPKPKRPAGVPRPVHDQQFVAILKAANRRRTRTMILLAALAGFRVHEIAKVHGRDFDLESGHVTVDGKGGKIAAIPLHPLLAVEAAAYPRDGYWFPSYSGAEPHIGRQAVSKAIRQAMERAGVRASAHQLRHWYGTSLLAHGVDIRVVQELMRHSSLQSTQIYTQVSDLQRAAGIARLELPGVA